MARRRRGGGSAYEFDRTAEGRRVFEEDTETSLGAYAAALEAMGPDAAASFLSLAEDFLGHYRREVASPDD